MIICTRSGGSPKVGGISAASSAPIRPLVPAPTLNQRPPPPSTQTSTSTARLDRGQHAADRLAGVAVLAVDRGEDLLHAPAVERAGRFEYGLGGPLIRHHPRFGRRQVGMYPGPPAEWARAWASVSRKRPSNVSNGRASRRAWPARPAPRAAAPAWPRRRGSDAAAGFAPSLEAVLERHAETAEALAILAAGDLPPLGGVGEVSPSLARARKGGTLAAEALLELRGTLAALRETAGFFEARREAAPRLARIAAAVREQAALERRIEAALEPSGEVRDSASPELARARRESRSAAAEIQQRLERLLQDPDLRSRLSDAYFTVRNDRYVLPVRADAKGAVRGILHDASRSGTTVFVEPEALVELNNRLRQSGLSVQREALRVLEELSAAAGAAADEIEAGISALTGIDLAFARAALAQELRATRPEVGSEGVVRAFGLRHPLLPADEAVANDARLGEDYQVLVLSGPNAGGKTVALKSVALAALCVRAGLFVPAEPGARVDLFDAVLADIGDEQDIRESLSTFSAHMANLARIVDEATPRSLVVLDEIGVGTDPSEGAAVAQACLEALADRGARVITTTHYNLLKEMAEVDSRVRERELRVRPGDARADLPPAPRPPRRVFGARRRRAHGSGPGRAGPREPAARPRGPPSRPHALGAGRQPRRARARARRGGARARRERGGARRIRGEARRATGAARDALSLHARGSRTRLPRGEGAGRRRGARAAARRLGDATPPSRSSASARSRRERREVERDAGFEAAAAPPPAPLDWRHARVGDAVAIRGGGQGRLLALPDQRGRVAVGVGGARLIVPMARVGAASAAQPSAARPAALHGDTLARFADAEAPGAQRCDLRGLRVDEALDRLVEELDRAAAQGSGSLTIVHGIGTGALRDAVRRHLKESPYVARFGPGEPGEGGEGVTIARLEP